MSLIAGAITLEDSVHRVGEIVEVAGVAVIVVGLTASMLSFFVRWLRERDLERAYTRARQSLGRSILLGLEILVAGDIIRTVALDPSFTSVGVLAIVVAVRTFLSFTLEVELTGHWPWQASSEERSAA